MNYEMNLKYDSMFAESFKLYHKGRLIAEIDQAGLSESAHVNIAGQSYTLKRDGWFSGNFSLHGSGYVICTAKKVVLRRKFIMECGDIRCILKAVSLFGNSAFDVLIKGRVAGRIERSSWFTRNATIRLPEGFPVELKVFMAWLVHIMWRRARNG